MTGDSAGRQQVQRTREAEARPEEAIADMVVSGLAVNAVTAAKI